MAGAYDAHARLWASEPARIYGEMAAAFVASAPEEALRDARVLDFGAGTGVATKALERAGASMIAADLAFGMLAVDRTSRPPAVVADVLTLPFRNASFRAALGAFVISHLRDPAAGLREVARVVADGGLVMVLGYDERWQYTPKAAVETVLVDAGYRRPEWYEEFKREIEPQTANASRLATVARDAGLRTVHVETTSVDTHATTADAIVAWRLATPFYADFLGALDEATRADVVARAIRAVGPDPEPLRPTLLVLTARA